MVRNATTKRLRKLLKKRRATRQRRQRSSRRHRQTIHRQRGGDFLRTSLPGAAIVYTGAPTAAQREMGKVGDPDEVPSFVSQQTEDALRAALTEAPKANTQ